MTAPTCQACDAEPVKPCAYCPFEGAADLCPECGAEPCAPGACIGDACASKDSPADDLAELLRDRPSHATAAPELM